MVYSTSGLDLVHLMKVTEPEYFHSMVKMHLSFLLDLHTDECDCSFLYDKQEKESKVKKAFTPMKKRSTKGVMDGVPLTQEGVCQVYQIVEYLGRTHNITCEGLFRKHGNLKKQQALKERLNKGVPLNLDDDEFSVHECAAVLKNFLANLPEPLLSDAYYRAHCQVPLICRDSMTDDEKKNSSLKQIACLQLLFQLIPEVNYTLLKDLLHFLNAVSKREDSNKMSASNLGTIFATHIMCPRKLSPEALHATHQLLGKAVTFMIEHAEELFTIPEQLVLDIENHLNNKPAPMKTPKAKNRKGNAACTPKMESPIVNTVFSFVDREASKTNANATDQALASLYAHVQGMPESAQKRKLVTKLNQANGKGTPDVATSGSVRTVGRRHRRKSGDGLINLLTPRRKRPTHGSYNFRLPESTQPEAQHCFRRQISLQPPTNTIDPVKRMSPSQSSPAILSPRDLISPRGRLRSPCATPASQASDVCTPVDEVDTPGKQNDEEDDHASSITTDDDPHCTGDHEGSFIAPPLPPRTPAPIHATPIPPRNASATAHGISPITRAGSAMSGVMYEAAMTPRSRAPVMVCSSSQLDKWNKIIERSTSMPDFLTEDEEDVSTDQESDRYFASLECESEPEFSPVPKSKSSCRSRSLSSEFKDYLARQGLQVPSDTSSLEDSVLTEGDMSYSEDVRRLLRNDGEKLSTSMQAILDGDDPASLDGPPLRKSPRLSSQGSSCSRSSSTSTIKAADISLQESDENHDPNVSVGSVGVKRGRKRRSLTEVGATNPLAHTQQGNIFFETDL